MAQFLSRGATAIAGAQEPLGEGKAEGEEGFEEGAGFEEGFEEGWEAETCNQWEQAEIVVIHSNFQRFRLFWQERINLNY